jgi:hypothetical protein
MDLGHTNNNPVDLILQSMIELKKKLIGSCRRVLFSHAGMRSESLILYLLERKILGRLEFKLILEI